MKISVLLIEILAASPLLTILPEIQVGSPEEAIQDEILFKIATEELATWHLFAADAEKPMPNDSVKTLKNASKMDLKIDRR